MKSISSHHVVAILIVCALALTDVDAAAAPPEADSTAKYLRKLTASDPKIQAEGLSDIAVGHEGLVSCLPALVNLATRSTDQEIQTRSLQIIAEVGPHAAAVSRQLHGLLRHPSSETRIAAADAILALESRNERAVQVLGECLSDPNVEIRAKAASVLYARELAGQNAIPQLLKACGDLDEQVRRQVAQALGSVTPGRREDVVQALRGLLEDSSFAVRGAAAEALWTLDEPADRLLPTLIALVEHHKLDPQQDHSHDVWGHDAGVELLGQIGPEAKAAVPALIRALDSPQVGERMAAADALGKIGLGAAPAVERLAQSLRDTESHSLPFVHRAWNVSDHAAEALRRIGDASRPTLIRAIQDKDARVRALAAQKLPSLTVEPDVVAALMSQLDDQDSSVRAITAFSLGRLGSAAKLAVPRLAELLNDRGKWTSFPGGGIGTSYDVGSHAYEALRAIAPRGAELDELVESIRERLERDGRLEPACLAMISHLGPDAKRLVPALERLLADNKSRLAAAQALSRIAPSLPGVLEILQQELRRKENGDVVAAARALGNLGMSAKEVIPKLYELLESKESSRDPAILAAAIVKIDSQEERAVRELAAALQYPNYQTAGHEEAVAIWRSLGPRAAPAEEQLLEGLVPKATNPDEDSYFGPLQASRDRLQCAKLLVSVGRATPPVLDALSELLNSGHCDIRGETAIVLAELGPDAAATVPVLVKQLADEAPYWVGGDFYGNSGVQHLPGDHAAETLSKIGAPAIPTLRVALRDEDRRVRERSARALGQIGEPARIATADLVVTLSDSSFVVRTSAAEALGEIPDDRNEVLAALAERLSDNHLQVRIAAAKALGKRGQVAKPFLPQLERLEQDPFAEGRRAAHEAKRLIAP